MSRFGRVAVLFGGNSAERDVSLRSGQAVLSALQHSGVDAYAVDPKHQSLAELAASKPDRVFIVLHGRGGEDGSMQGALEQLNLPYTGSKVLGSALAMDKSRCKGLFRALGIPTADFQVLQQVEQATHELLQSLGGKVMVKPANEGSSIGMSVAADEATLKTAVAAALVFDRDVLVERWIDGRELTVSVLGEQVLPIIEMRTPRDFYDYEAKYQVDTTEYLCPAPLNEALTQQVQQIAWQAFTAVAASGWGRVDFMLDAHNQPYVLEVNTVPGMTEKSLVPMAAKAAGYTFNELVLAVLDQTIAEKEQA
ncbi:D-alanine--D-alanine ligase [Alkalimonas collagenimarina]|uniref:D-alanine--D-alanine ligase n=1 Tax=Alkalimonas collagenimarina TaxID=400390 RepID=A0ABT9H048_9GAMM|nr:D-alanine--D-alanine ligase [Alkalimonas collagenimarina]MDP4536484.1 D-alanine--D-alanine ligase [Alkalimonas collagenimarina]